VPACRHGPTGCVRLGVGKGHGSTAMCFALGVVGLERNAARPRGPAAPRLFIMTYDYVIDRARTNLERHLGPLSIKSNLELYFYRNDHAQAV
jgi:hypothetical protein